jgi:hypothetical protein
MYSDVVVGAVILAIISDSAFNYLVVPVAPQSEAPSPLRQLPLILRSPERGHFLLSPPLLQHFPLGLFDLALLGKLIKPGIPLVHDRLDFLRRQTHVPVRASE